MVPLAGRRRRTAISNASTTSSWRMCGAIAQPTIRRLKRSCTAARYSQPSPVRVCLISAAHTRLGPSGRKSRPTRSPKGSTPSTPELCAALGRYWLMRQRHADAVSWIDRALDLPGAEEHARLRVRVLDIKARAVWPLGRAVEQPAIDKEV